MEAGLEHVLDDEGLGRDGERVEGGEGGWRAGREEGGTGLRVILERHGGVRG